jgi:EpsI family protein
MMATYFRAPTVSALRLVLAIAIMAAAIYGSERLKPAKYWSSQIGDPKYAQILPDSFGNWANVQGGAAVVVNPVQSEMLDKIYSETVSRIYVNRLTGRSIMLSVAYGRDQSSDTQLHTPEMCYSSQGFKVEPGALQWLHAPGGQMPVVRLDTNMGPRHEPLTYFVRNGDYITTEGSLQRNVARLKAAVLGYKVDGLLVRVSEVTRQSDSFDLQSQFLLDLFKALPEADRYKLIGKVATPRS